MAAVAVAPSSGCVNQTNLEKIESFFNDPSYKEALESSVTYNTRLCIERRLRLPFIDTQTGVAQNHSALFMNRRQRIPGLLPGQIYTYPRQRWRKKRRQYLAMNSRAFARAADAMLDEGDIHNISQIENPALQDTDSKDSQLLLKDEVSKEWFYDDQDMLEMDAYDEPDPDSDLDYEETYTKRRRGKRATGRGRSGTDSPSTPGRKKGGGRGRKKGGGHSFEPTPGDPDKPFACELCGARYKTRPGLTYHYGHSHKDGASDENSRDSNAPTPTAQMGGGGGPSAGGGFPVVPGPPPQGPPMAPMGPVAHMSGGGPMGEVPPVPVPQGPSQGHVYQDSYVSFLNQTPGTPGRRGRAPNAPPPMGTPPPGMPPMTGPPLQQQAPPTLPPNLPPQHPTISVDDPPMPVLVAEKQIEPSMSVVTMPVPGPSDGPPAPGPGPGEKKATPSPYCDFCLGDSRENKKTGGTEELVSCSDCGRSGHPTCLQFTDNMKISVKKYRWQCIECKCCSVCGTSDNDDQLLFCDDCDRGYHMYCLTPPLVNPPEGSWSCKLCIEQFHKS